MDSRFRFSRVYQRLSISVFDVRRHICLAMGFTVEQSAKFEALYRAVTNVEDNTKLVQMVDDLIKLMIDNGEAQVKNISVSRVVPHAANRAGSLMEAHKVYKKGAKIMAVGFSLARCDHRRAVAFQAKPGDTSGIMNFVKHANRSPSFANFNAEDVEACSVGCGHLNQFLAAIEHESVVPPGFENHNDLFGNRGGKKLDKHFLCKSQGQQLETTLDIGLKWTFIPFKFEKDYPKLPHVIQKALNADQHVAEGETWDEQFRSLAEGIVDACKISNGKPIDYVKVAKQVIASEPPRKSDIPAQLEFGKKWGGGPKQNFSLDICTFARLVNTTIVAAGTFIELNALKIKADQSCPHFVAAVVKSNACRTVTGPSGHEQPHITAADIKHIIKEIEAVLEAEDYMKKAKVIEDSMENASWIAVARGEMEVAMVDFVLNKLSKADREKTSLTDISRSQYGNSWKRA